MQEKIFEVKGTYHEKQQVKKFTKEISAANERNALEKILSLMGSKHRLKRKDIKVQEIKRGKADDKEK